MFKRKLTDDQVIEILTKHHKELIKPSVLAKEYELSKTTIDRILNREVYKDVQIVYLEQLLTEAKIKIREFERKQQVIQEFKELLR